MERLTERDNNVALVTDCACLSLAIERLAEYEDTGYTPEEIKEIELENEELLASMVRFTASTILKYESEEIEELNTENERLMADRVTMREALEDIAKIEIDSKYDNIFRPYLLHAVLTARRALSAITKENDNG